MAKQNESRTPLPPYTPFKTITNFVQKLKDTTVPPRIDSSLLRSYSGSVGRQIMAAMKWLDLIDESGHSKPSLSKIVAAYGTDNWGDEFGTVISAAYYPVIGDLDLDKATLGMLSEKFRTTGADGQVLQKCITFYLNAARNAGWVLSPHLADKTRARPDKKPRARKNNGSEGEHAAPPMDIPPAQGMVRFNFPIPDKTTANIVLPADVSQDDWEMVSSMISAYISRRSKAKV